jgi:rifampicin phosphotransferase
MIVRNFKESQKAVVGGKAKGLYALQQAGLNVPDFIVLPVSTTVTPAKESTSTNTFQLSKEDERLLLETLSVWSFPDNPVVVRSSIEDEDGPLHSFAGMMDSYLNLRTFDAVFHAIGSCVQSVYSERSQAYRKQRSLSLPSNLGIIIQKQIEATSSGILFTTSPDFPQEVAIHAVPGFSENLNKGGDVPDEFYLWKKDGILNRKKITAKEYLYASHPVQGLVKCELSKELKERDTLNANQLQEMYQASVLIEKWFGYPCDVEFVFCDKTLFIVQARPITQPIPEVIVYDNSNIQESYCGVTSPLTFSFASRAYATVYRQTMRALMLPENIIQQQEKVIQNLLGFVKGRIYYNINNWYRGLQLLPSFRQNKADMEKMMGLIDPVDFVEDKEKSFCEKCVLLPRLLVNLCSLILAFRKLPRNIERFTLNCQQYSAQFYSRDITSLSIQGLLIEKEKLDANLLNQWTVPIVNDFYVMMNNGKAIRNLKRLGIENTNEFLSQYLSGRHLASLESTLQLQQLAQEAGKNNDLAAVIMKLPLDINSIIENSHPAFYHKVLSYIAKYGDRTIGELKLETETMRVNPLIFYKYLQNFLSSPLSNLRGDGMAHKQAVAELAKKLSDKNFLFGKRVRKNLAKLESAINNREAMRLERTRLFGMYREIYLAIGAQFARLEIINTQRDIFYLTEDEIIAFEQRHEVATYKNKIAERMRSFDLFRKEEAPSRVIVPYPPAVDVLLESRAENSLKGTGCYPGLVEGEVLVITDPSQDIQAAGKIICALRTDPGWAALFPSCKGVLIEKGSSLSHSVILLRELGIPTIINIPNLTKRLKTGQRIQINATEGKIEMIDYAVH